MIYFKFYVLLCFVFANLRAKIHLFYNRRNNNIFYTIANCKWKISNVNNVLRIMHYELFFVPLLANMSMTEKERILILRQQLNEHNRRYYIENNPIISDQEYDLMMHELQDLEARHPEMYDAASPYPTCRQRLEGSTTTVTIR